MVPVDVVIPAPADSCWTDLVTGAISPAFRTLAVQMMVFRLRQSVGQDGSPGNLARACAELHGYFANQSHLPTVREDLAAIRRSAP